MMCGPDTLRQIVIKYCLFFSNVNELEFYNREINVTTGFTLSIINYLYDKSLADVAMS